jgi:hypothetical protein
MDASSGGGVAGLSTLALNDEKYFLHVTFATPTASEQRERNYHDPHNQNWQINWLAYRCFAYQKVPEQNKHSKT